VITVSGLDVCFGKRAILSSVNFTAMPGCITVLLGPNGSGKSTLLRTLAGFHKPKAGSVRTSSQSIAFMPQDNDGGSALTVRQAVLIGRIGTLGFRVRNEEMDLAEEWMARLAISELANRNLNQISGGQRQLVYLAQTMMRSPAILLLDEPTSALDLANQLSMLDAVVNLTKDRQITTMIAMHDIALAVRVASHLLVMKEGSIFSSGSNSEVLTPSLLREAFGVEGLLIGADGPHPSLQLYGKT
jgi:iron complex transport system ATP-binding protein